LIDSRPAQYSSPRARDHHAYLLVVLASVIVVPPFLAEWVLGDTLIEALLFFALLTGSYVTAANHRRFVLCVTVAVLAVAARLAWRAYPSDALLYSFLGCHVAFFSVVGATLVGHLFGPHDRISSDTLFGAISVYLILGIVWAYGYAILEAAAPGSFTFGAQRVLTEARFDRFLGFSFTTLTTLGYGNVSPATPKADALSTMEAIVGQCYLAIVIARLVALQIAQAKP
jgi:hypothetical protein